MENSWQMKCGSSTQSMASFTSQEPRNQMETDSGRYFYPHLTRDLRSTMHGRMQDPMYPNIRNINSCRLGHTELGNSFLALLSGPPTLLQCDFQELPNLKAISASSSKLPIDGGVVNISAVGSGVLPTAGGLLSEHYGNSNVQNGANICPVVSSGAVLNNNFSGKPILHDGRQAANLCLQTSDLTKAVIHQLVPSNEKARDFSSAKGKWQSTSSATVGKLCTSNIPTSQKVSPATNYSISSQSSSLTSVCPRVFCLGASGDLLLSNTGLLGIVCSCHHFRMSVAKFCEHLGLREVNPGFAVQMENGETIAQWRKLYFQKFGQREHWMVMFL